MYNPCYRVPLVSSTYWDLQCKGHHKNYNSTGIRTKFHLGFISYSFYQLLLYFLYLSHFSVRKDRFIKVTFQFMLQFNIPFILQHVYYYDRQKLYAGSEVLCSSVAQDFVLLGYDAVSRVNHITKSQRMILP